jgi:hypothetical protein
MKYGVVVCPKCRTPKAVLLSTKTSRCTRCNKVLILEKIKIVHKTNSEAELRHIIGLINAEKYGSNNNFKKIISKQKL